MNDRKKKGSEAAELDMSLNDALARFIQTDPKELADAFERNKQSIEEIQRSADERRQRLRAATRGPTKRFNP
jgi:hypothetical protein